MRRTISPSPHRAGFTLAEVLFALALITFSFASLFAIFSQGLKLVHSQQETMSVTLCLQQRHEQIRSLKWPSLTDATRLGQSVFASPPVNQANLPGLDEQITVSAYPPLSPVGTPVCVRRQPGGTVTTISAPTDLSISGSSTVRVDVRLSWSSGSRTRVRESSTIVAMGGIQP